jgi:hypothetical protein
MVDPNEFLASNLGPNNINSKRDELQEHVHLFISTGGKVTELEIGDTRYKRNQLDKDIAIISYRLNLLSDRF